MFDKLKTFVSKKLLVTLGTVLFNHYYSTDPALAAKIDGVIGTAYVIIQGLVDIVATHKKAAPPTSAPGA